MVKNTFILTTFRGAENTAGSEIYMLLTEFGDNKAKVNSTGVPGVLQVDTALSHQEVIDVIKKIVEFEPWRIRYMLRLLPVEKIVDMDMNNIVETVKTMAERIGANESFRVTVDKRHSPTSKDDLIKNIANVMDRKVDLDNPDWIILVELVNDWTGISVIRPSQILNIVKAKRGDQE